MSHETGHHAHESAEETLLLLRGLGADLVQQEDVFGQQLLRVFSRGVLGEGADGHTGRPVAGAGVKQIGGH